MSFCTTCGYSIKPNHSFCGKCGVRLKNSESEIQSPVNSQNLDDESNFEKAVELFVKGKFEESSILLDDVLSHEPEHAKAMELKISSLLSFGIALRESGDQRAVNLFEESLHFCDLLEKSDPIHYKNTVEKRNLRIKINHFLNNENIQSNETKKDEGFNIKIAENLMENDEYGGAIPYLDKHLMEFPNDSHAHFLKGVSLSFLDDDQNAIKYFELSRELDPENTPHSQYFWRYANSLYHLQRYADALEMNEHALAIEPENPEFLNGRAHLFLIYGIDLLENKKGNPMNYFNQSLEYFDKVLELNPDHQNALFGKSEVLKILKDLNH